MLNCLTKKEIQLGDLIIPPLTEGTILTTKNNITANAPGVRELVSILYWDCQSVEKQLLKIDSVHPSHGARNIHLEGLTLRISTDNLYILYVPELYETQLSKWQTDKIIVPIEQDESKPSWQSNYDRLGHIVNCIDDWFTNWVQKNCKFRKCNASDRAENSELEPGMRILTDDGLDRFYAKRKELMINLGEATGYTLEFEGGLIWN